MPVSAASRRRVGSLSAASAPVPTVSSTAPAGAFRGPVWNRCHGCRPRRPGSSPARRVPHASARSDLPTTAGSAPAVPGSPRRLRRPGAPPASLTPDHLLRYATTCANGARPPACPCARSPGAAATAPRISAGSRRAGAPRHRPSRCSTPRCPRRAPRPWRGGRPRRRPGDRRRPPCRRISGSPGSARKCGACAWPRESLWTRSARRSTCRAPTWARSNRATPGAATRSPCRWIRPLPRRAA